MVLGWVYVIGALIVWLVGPPLLLRWRGIGVIDGEDLLIPVVVSMMLGALWPLVAVVGLLVWWTSSVLSALERA